MNFERFKIGEEDYSTYELELLTEEPANDKVPNYILMLAKVLETPMKLPRMLKSFCELRSSLGDEEQEDLRMALLRVQIDSELRMNQDIQRYQQRRYVAQVIEILLFKELFLAPHELEDIELME